MKENYSSPGMKSWVAKRNIQKAAAEMKANPPAILAQTRRKEGAKQAEKQRVAIMLSKARRGE